MDNKSIEGQIDSSVSYRFEFFKLKSIIKSIEFSEIFEELMQTIDYLLSESLNQSIDKQLVQNSLQLISQIVRRDQKMATIETQIKEKVFNFLN